ncbi:MAG: NAD-dependent epimerase/dehydratase family protein [Chloroflexales bacterium]|nr:NAD-dependent epimerase/dehydratase family protein [Chloroflexales bacterium]
MPTLIEGDPEVRRAFAGARVLVTGGAGFIAGHLAAALCDLGAEVLLVDERPAVSSTRARQLLARCPTRQLRSRECRLGTPAFHKLYADEASFDYIFHLAARAYAAGSVAAPYQDFSDNLAATLDLLELLRESRATARLLFASSAAVYGNPAKLPIEESDMTVPLSPYGVSKLAAERYIAVYARLYGLRATSMRLFSVYGPHQAKQVVFDFFQKLHDSPRELVVLGDGSQARDLVYVADVVEAFLVAAARGPGDGSVYNVASGACVSTAELARMVSEVQATDSVITFTGSLRPGDPERWLGSWARLADLGWQPRYSLRAGLHATAEWFSNYVSASAREVGAA